MRPSLLLVAAAGLFCGFTATPDYERQVRDSVGGSITQATEECWGNLKGKAQAEWYAHLRKIDEPARAEAVVTWTTKSVARCVAHTTGSHAHDPSVWRIVDAFVKQRFHVQPRSG